MRERFALGSLVAVLLAATVVLPGCGGGSSAANTTIVTSLAISPTSASVALNGTIPFTVQVNGGSNLVTTTLTFEVNGVSGGTASTGTMVVSPTDALVGNYTAPGSITTVNTFNITVVSPVDPSNPSDTQTITSNTATVTVTPGLGLSVSPSSTDVEAGGTQQFAASLNSVPDHNATWSVMAPNGGNPGTIDASSGLYFAPPSPPIGAQVIITATDNTLGPGNTATATATATIIFADASFSGPYAYSYTGNNSSGFQAVAGSLTSDGKGNITNFVQDIISFPTPGTTTVSCAAQPGSPCGTYIVGADGRGTITLNSSGQQGGSTLRFALTTNQHAVLTRFDAGNTGTGTMDQQNLSDLGGSALAISGPYAFRVFGGDIKFGPEGIGGLFSASPGATNSGTIPELNSVVDLNDNGIVTIADQTLQGSYSFDPNFPGTGRGFLNLSSTAIAQLQFAFYIVDSTHLYLVEIDKNGFLAGDVFSAPGPPAGGGGFTVASFAKGSYPFTLGGNAGNGGYSAGGILVTDGDGNTTGASVFDNNAGGTVQLTPTFVGCPYTVDPATGRIALSFSVAGAGCVTPPTTAATAGNSAKNAFTFAAYQTSRGSILLLELDSSVISAGAAFLQQLVSSSLTGDFGFNLGNHTVVNSSPGPNQQDALGQAILNGTTVTMGNLDINAFKQVFENDPICTEIVTGCTSASSIVTAAASGRGTAILVLGNPETTYNIVYYIVNGNSALLFGQAAGQTQVVQTGVIQLQF